MAAGFDSGGGSNTHQLNASVDADVIGFTIGLHICASSLNRYDARGNAVVDEANAIGTAYLRADLTPIALRQQVRQTLREYLELRIQEAGITADHQKESHALLLRTEQKQAELWQYAQQVAAENSTAISALFVGSINELIDSYGRRETEFARHVPDPVVLLFMLTFALAGMVVGYAAGTEGHRPSHTTYALVFHIVPMLSRRTTS